MPRAGQRRRTESSGETRDRLVDAASWVLATRGFAAATARGIAEEAECNSALVFYHHGTLNDLLLQALDKSNQQALERYRAAIEGVDGVRGLIDVVRDLYPEDHASGHINLLAQMVAGGIVDRELGLQVSQRVQPWLELANGALTQALPTPLRRRFPTAEVSYLVVAAALGAELLATLAGDHTHNRATLQRLTEKRGVLRRVLTNT